MRGGQWQALHLLRGLVRRGHNVRLLAHSDAPLAEAARAEGIAVDSLTRAQVREASRGVDLVHAHDARSHGLAVLGARAPLVVSRRVAFPVLRNPFSRWKYRRAQHYIAVSNAVAAELLAAGVPDAKISIVADGVEIPESVMPYEERPRPPVVVAAETSDPAKGSDWARDAAARAGLELQFSAQLADDLQRARIFLYLSRQEGLGSAALLAMARGVPVVASRVGGLVEVVEHEVTGLLCDNDPEPIAAALRRIADDPALAARLSAASRGRAVERYSVDAMVVGTLAAYALVKG